MTDTSLAHDLSREGAALGDGAQWSRTSQIDRIADLVGPFALAPGIPPRLTEECLKPGYGAGDVCAAFRAVTICASRKMSGIHARPVPVDAGTAHDQRERRPRQPSNMVPIEHARRES